MTNQIIDCCSLINLYTGWDSLEPLLSLNIMLHISEAVIDEGMFVNEFDVAGKKVRKMLDLRSMQPALGFAAVRPETSEEIFDYVNFATEVDDGEAQSLAIAKHRNLILLSDDRKALALARREDISVKTMTSVEVLQSWALASVRNSEELPNVLRRISDLARFRPKPNSREREWWDSNISKNGLS